MNRKKLSIMILGIVIASISLLYGGLQLYIYLDNCYSPYETYGKVTIATTKYEVRIDDTNNNSGSTLMHNVLLYGIIGDDLYIIDKNNNKIMLNIYTKDFRRISNGDELSEQEKKNFEAVSLYEYEDFRYVYQK